MNDMFKYNLAASFQYTIAEILKNKLELTLNYLNKKNISISQVSLVGGVAANKYIYKSLNKIAAKLNCSLILPPKFMFGDNASMIGWACIQKKSIKDFSNIHFKPNPRLTINKKTK